MIGMRMGMGLGNGQQKSGGGATPAVWTIASTADGTNYVRIQCATTGQTLTAAGGAEIKLESDGEWGTSVVVPSGEVEQAEYATMDTTLVSPSGNAAVDLAVGYNEGTNLFNLKANFSETIPELKPVIKKSLIAPTASLMFGYRQFNDAIPERLGVGAGVKIMNKYSIQLTADTDKTYGITLGVDL